MSTFGHCRDCKNWSGLYRDKHGRCSEGIQRIGKLGHSTDPTFDFGCTLFQSRQDEKMEYSLAETCISAEKLRAEKRYELAKSNLHGYCCSTIPLTAEEAARRSVHCADALLAELAKEKL